MKPSKIVFLEKYHPVEMLTKTPKIRGEVHVY